MYRITNFTADAKQRVTVQLADGTSFLMRISYSDTQHGWFINEITYQSVTIYTMRMVNAQNLLRQYKNQIPFGLYITTPNSRDVMTINDLIQGITNVYVLSAAEVASYESYISGRS